MPARPVLWLTDRVAIVASGGNGFGITHPSDCHVYLVDGSGYIFRAFHALPPLTRPSDGLPVVTQDGDFARIAEVHPDLRVRGV